MEQKYQIRILSKEETEHVYTKAAVRHFPANELKPLKAIWRMMDAGCYETLGMYLDGQLVSYAFFVQTKDKQNRLLDYYAVMEDYRGNGIGGLFLQRMREWYSDCQGIILETEDIALAQNEEEYKIRARRNAFYVQNGVVETPIKTSYFSADYQIFYLPIKGKKTISQVHEGIRQIYSVMFLDKVDEIVKITGIS